MWKIYQYECHDWEMLQRYRGGCLFQWHSIWIPHLKSIRELVKICCIVLSTCIYVCGHFHLQEMSFRSIKSIKSNWKLSPWERKLKEQAKKRMTGYHSNEGSINWVKQQYYLLMTVLVYVSMMMILDEHEISFLFTLFKS